MVDHIESTMRIDYSDEFHQDFQRMQSVLRQTCRARSMPSGAKTIAFDTAGLTGRAKQKLRDGNLPYGRPNTGQVTADLKEYFESYTLDDFDAFRNNPQLRSNYMAQAMGVCNRETDAQIVEELATTTEELSAGASAFSTLATFLDATTTLYNNDIPPNDGKLWWIMTPNAYAQMMRITDFKSSDFVDVKPMQEGAPAIGRVREFMGVKILQTTGLTGVGTALAETYLYHEDAMGFADDGNPTFKAGIDEKNGDTHWCWARIRIAVKAVLSRGIIRVHHDDTAAFS